MHKPIRVAMFINSLQCRSRIISGSPQDYEERQGNLMSVIFRTFGLKGGLLKHAVSTAERLGLIENVVIATAESRQQ